MHPDEKQKFDVILSAVAQMYARKMTKVIFDLYFAALKNYDFQMVRKALECHLVNPDVGQFMPKPADIVREIDGGTEDRALLAWTKVENAIKHIGNYETVVFDDWKIHVVIVDLGGWIALCKITEKESPFKAKEFITRFRGIRVQRSYSKTLIGVIEMNNRCIGYTNNIPEPRFIGNQKKCEEVMSGGQKQLSDPTAISNLLPKLEEKHEQR